MLKSMISNISAGLASGGTVDGDLTITGDFKVEGAGSFAYDEIIEGSIGLDTSSPAITMRNGSTFYNEFKVTSGNTILKTSGGSQDLIFGTADVEKMRITSAGLVGIGTTSPATTLHTIGSTGLRVEGTSGNHGVVEIKAGDGTAWSIVTSVANDNLDFYNSTSGTAMSIKHSNGHVGIGTNSPSYKLDIVQSGDYQFRVGSSANKYVSIEDDVMRFKGMTGNGMRILTIDSSDINFGTNTTLNRLVIKADGKIGIGTASPNGKVAIHSASAGGSSAIYNRADELVIENSDHAGITIKSPTDKETSVFFGDADDSSRGGIRYNHDGDTMTFQVASAKLILDLNSRISLSNNDSGSSNTIFGKSAGANLDAGSNYNTFIGEGVSDASMDDAQWNTGVGNYALSALTTGDANTAVGNNALNDVTTGSSNVAVGSGASDALTTGSNNVAIGLNALGAETDAGTTVAVGRDSARMQNASGSTYSTFVGDSAGYHNVIGKNNTYLGALAGAGVSGQSNDGNVGVGGFSLNAITTGNENTAVGKHSLDTLTTGSHNVVLGSNAGYTLTTTAETVLVGYKAGYGINSADANGTTAVGHNALLALTDGQYNTAVGYQAGKTMTTATNNSFFGYQSGHLATGSGNAGFGGSALYVLAGGTNNSAFGSQSHQNLTSGGNNTAVGHASGYGVTTGSDNVNIGKYTSFYNQAGSDNIAIGTSSMQGSSNYNSSSCVAIGYHTLINFTGQGTGTIAVGFKALTALTSGLYNTAVGYEAGKAMTANASNTIMGYGAFKLADGNEDKNVVIGAGAGDQMNSDQIDNNVIIGKEAWRGGTGLLSASVVIGSEAGKTPHVRNVYDSVFIGHKVAFQEFGGACNYNIGIGTLAMSAGNLNDAHGNVAVGWKSMEALTQSDNNVAIGRESLKSITSGAGGNVALGYLSGRDATGTKNVYIGYQAGMQQTSGSGSINIGNLAGQIDSSSPNIIIGAGAFASSNNSSSGSNVIVGYEAGGSINSANSTDNVILGRGAGGGGTGEFTENIAIGSYALDSTTDQAKTGTIAIGHQSLTNLNAGDNNTAIGYKSLTEHQDQDNNTVLGYNVASNTNGSHCADNTFIGTNTANGSWAGTARYNTAVGMESMYGDMDGAEYNTALGKSALRALVSGDNNLALGNNAGEAITTGSNNVLVGYDSEASAVGASNQIVIGASTTGLGDNYAVIGNANITRLYVASDGAGVLYANGTIQTSDERLKENIEDSDLGLEFINKIRPVSYNYINDKQDGKTKYGIIAQEVQEVLKESSNEDFAGIKDSDEYLGADYNQFVAPLIKAVQELSAEVKQLKQQLEDK